MRRFVLLAALWVVIGSLILLWPKGRVQSQALAWTAPIVDAIRAPVRLWRRMALWWEKQSQLVARVRALEEENARARLLAMEVASLRMELAALKALVQAPGKMAPWRAVRVIGSLPAGPARRLLVVGAAKPDEAVVAPGGLVGVVDEVRGAHAVVRTILDASVAVPATDSTRTLALLVRGEGTRLVVRFAPAHASLKSGDVIYTSGAGGLFPPGVPIARITKVRKVRGSLFLEVEAVPTAQWRTTPYLAVVPRS